MQIKRSSDGGTAPRCLRVGSKLSVFTIDKLVLDVQCQTKYYQRFLCFGHDQFVSVLKMTKLVPDKFALIILQVLSIYCVNFGLEHRQQNIQNIHSFIVLGLWAKITNPCLYLVRQNLQKSNGASVQSMYCIIFGLVPNFAI